MAKKVTTGASAARLSSFSRVKSAIWDEKHSAPMNSDPRDGSCSRREDVREHCTWLGLPTTACRSPRRPPAACVPESQLSMLTFDEENYLSSAARSICEWIGRG